MNEKRFSYLSMSGLCALMLTVFVAMGLTACTDNIDNGAPNNSKTDIEQQKLEEWKPCNKLTYISGIEKENPELQAVIRDRFPNQTSSLSEAEVAFFSYNTLFNNIEEADDFFARGGLIVMMRPSKLEFDGLGDYLDFVEFDEEGTFDDDFDIDEHFTDNEEMEEMFYAYNKDEKHYTMYEEAEFDGQYTDEINEMSAEEWESIRAYNERFPANSELNNKESLYDNDYAHNYNYFQARLTPFVDFIEEIDQQKQAQRVRRTRAADDGSDMKMSVEDGYFFVKDMPISLNHCIQKDFYWNKSSTVTIKYWVSSAYMLSSNGQNKAGDYYLVRSEITPHIRPLWEVGSRAGGMFNWGRCHIYAYWFDNMEVEYALVDANNQTIADKIQYYKHPIPENENTEYSYSNGFSWGLNGSVSGEGGKDGGKGGGSFGFNLQWSSDVSYALKTIQYERNTSSTYPKFKYTVNNIKFRDDDYENEAKTNANFPPITHTEFSTNTAWMWRVPRNSSLGVDDNSTTHFRLVVRVRPIFASWYAWRGAYGYESNKKTYWGYNPGNSIMNAFLQGWFTHTEDIPAPDRTPWGVVALKNAASTYTVGNIKIYKQTDYYFNSKYAEYTTIPSSYNMNEVARKAIPEGTYVITYQAIDPNQGNKVLGNWKIEDVVIKQGQSAAEATTEISTVNAKQIK